MTKATTTAATATPPPRDPWPADERLAPPIQAGDRVYSRVRFLWIRPRPGPTDAWLGYLSLGDSVRVRGGDAAAALIADAPTDGDRCRAWYAIEPVGYVCTGTDATLDAEASDVRALLETAADPRSPWPYHYGESLGTPIYRQLPERREQLRSEPDLEQHEQRVARLRAAATADAAAVPELAAVVVGPSGNPPPPQIELSPYARGVRTRVWPGSTIAFTRRFDADDRTWLLTWDWGIVPSDRVRPYPHSRFAGVALTGERQLPIAFFRERPRRQYRRTAAGNVEPTEQHWPRHGWVGLTDRSIRQGRDTYLETTDRGRYCAEADATVVRKAAELPPKVAAATDGRRTWLDISVLGGWLVAYEAALPVYATLISPGRGGVPYRGVPPIETASTPTGQFTVTGKFLTATMTSSSDVNIVHAEVQYTQNFSGPHALHGAYWHDDWGEKKSGGCVNLAPIDARRVFAWTDPTLPPGWHGVRLSPRGTQDSTVVSIHR